MGLYCWEAHAHTAEISPCGNIPAAELAELYIREGYTGVVITNHFSHYGFTYMRDTGWEEQVNWFYNGYLAVREAAGDRLRVLFGMELNVEGDPNDYLIYGVTKDFLLAHPELLQLDIRAVSRLVRENGMLLFQAHPFRNQMRIVPPDLLDGMETFNGNLRHDSRNFITAQWAERYGLLKVGGSDFHEYEDLARGGFFTGRDIQDNDDLLAALREGVIVKMSAEKFGL